MNMKISWTEIGLFVILILQGGYFVWQGSWSEVFVVVAATGLALVPYFLTHYYDVTSNQFIRIGIVLFTLCTLVLGEIYKFYDLFSWWDVFLHIVAGAGLAIVGYTWLFGLVRAQAVAATPFFHTMFVVSGSCLVLTLWEVYEFCIDQIGWSSNLMQPSLFDTMMDLIVGLGGTVVVCVAGYILLSKQKLHAVSKITSGD